MRPKIRVFLAVVGTCALWPSVAAAQATIREALIQREFKDALAAPNRPPLDDRITSSAFGSDSEYFVAAYYLERELNDQALGRLYLSSYDKRRRTWTHSRPRPPSGSVVGVDLESRFVFVSLHLTPSAGTQLVFDRSSLRHVASLGGFDLRLLADSTILFIGNMRHFAPTHQERLLSYDPRTGAETEVFPGPKESPIAAEYRQRVRETYKRLSAEQRAEYERTAFGAVDDFDRSIASLDERPGGGRIAFVVFYGADRLKETLASAIGVVRCDQQPPGMWLCEERAAEEVARQLRIDLAPGPGSRNDPAQLDKLVKAILKQP
jgi:hypothetical protein